MASTPSRLPALSRMAPARGVEAVVWAAWVVWAVQVAVRVIVRDEARSRYNRCR